HYAIAVAAAAAMALTSAAFTPATAAPASNHQAATGIQAGASAGTSQATDFSSRRRGHRYYRSRAADRAVLGAVAGVFGTIATLAARDRYERRYRHYYGYGPYYAAPPYR